MAKDSKPLVFVRRERDGRVIPDMPFDEELLSAFPAGQLFTLKPERNRSGRLHRTYWKMLREVCRATGRWPTEAHAHHALMWLTKYVTVEIDGQGIPRLVRDSIAWDAMTTDAEFRPYFNDAVQKLSEITGIDPLAFMAIRDDAE